MLNLTMNQLRSISIHCTVTFFILKSYLRIHTRAIRKLSGVCFENSRDPDANPGNESTPLARALISISSAELMLLWCTLPKRIRQVSRRGQACLKLKRLARAVQVKHFHTIHA
jgi:hypothetical protein